MAKKGEARERLTLQCTECKNENYRTEKNKRNTTERLELNKFCKFCKKTTLHKEKK
ncbi:MAG: 50S ribosomal protein L33 [Mycoplasmatota bacterium]